MGLWLDNTTAIAYINNMGGKRPELDRLAREIWDWCLEAKIWLTAAHIPGAQNSAADFESRHFNDRGEWSLDPAVFQQIINRLGTPEIDLFASRLNAKCTRYVAWQRDPQAEFVDAFSRSWTNFNGYAFPPFSLIAKVLQRIKQEDVTMIVVVPLWKTQPWFTVFLELLIQDPILLPQRDNLLTLQHKTDQLHPLRKKLRLLAGLLSGRPTRRQNYQRGLPRYSSAHGNRELTNNTQSILDNGTHFVMRGRLIVLSHL